ncbi:hypothetical protein VTJ04DRAFT_6772 [Mycothermus thermophilus]|uniref:uncharacterized protein n=1 Tax=Humicola insolens TaxID=85995 RepID=UPI0037426561
MTRYFEGRNGGVINDGIYLRDDLYDRFMERAMVFYPRPVQQQVETEKNAGPGPDTGDSTLTPPPRPSTIQLVVHVLRPGYSGQLTAQYHKRFIQPIRGPAVEFIFALLACAIFDVPYMPLSSQDENWYRMWVHVYQEPLCECFLAWERRQTKKSKNQPDQKDVDTSQAETISSTAHADPATQRVDDASASPQVGEKTHVAETTGRSDLSEEDKLE